MKLSKEEKKKLAKEIEKQISTNNKVAKVLEQNKGKLKNIGFKVKATTWYDPETKEKKVGGCIELYETKSKNKYLDGINIDLGATTDFDLLAGISKDFNLAKGEFSIGGYLNVSDLGKQIFKKNKEENTEKINCKISIGISKVF